MEFISLGIDTICVGRSIIRHNCGADVPAIIPVSRCLPHPGKDEPESLSCAISLNCPVSADGGQNKTGNSKTPNVTVCYLQRDINDCLSINTICEAVADQADRRDLGYARKRAR